MKEIFNIKLPNNAYGLVLLCGKQFEGTEITKNFNIHNNDFSLQKGWNVVHIGEEKEGYNLPWFLLFQFIKKHKKIKYFIFTDADGQIPLKEIQDIEIGNEAKVILTQRRIRQFGKFTFERNIIEDIENAFIRITSGEENITDFQSGLFIMHRSIVDTIDFNRVKKYKWIGDLYFLEQVIKNKINTQLAEVNTSKNHNTSSIFDYSSPMNEILIGAPILKMKELVDYSGLILNKVKNKMLEFPEVYIPTFFKYSINKNKSSNLLDEIKSYLDFIVGLYYRTADIYNIRL